MLDHSAGLAAGQAIPDVAEKVPASELGLNVDMLDVDRLRDWARLIDTHGDHISDWGDPRFVAGKLRDIADRLADEVRDVGQLRARVTEYLSSGGLFNPEMMEQDKVRNLLIDCRAGLHSAQSAPLSQSVEQAKARVITQAFVAGQMDAQLKHADELTRPSLKLLQAKAYALAQESMEALIASVGVELVAEIVAVLKAACDRDWKDETPLQVARIVANAIYWRDQTIARLKTELEEARELYDANHG